MKTLFGESLKFGFVYFTLYRTSSINVYESGIHSFFLLVRYLSPDFIQINENIILFTYSQYVKVNSKILIFVKYFILISYAR